MTTKSLTSVARLLFLSVAALALIVSVGSAQNAEAGCNWPTGSDIRVQIQQGKIKVLGLGNANGIFSIQNDTDCGLTVSAASFKMVYPLQQDNGAHQYLYAATDPVWIAPHSTSAQIVVPITECNVQVDIFEGNFKEVRPDLPVLATTAAWNQHVIAGMAIETRPQGFCPPQTTPTPTPTSTPTPTPTPTATPTPTPTPVVVTKTKGLSVQKTDHRDVTRPGHTATYEITVKNTGEVDLNDVKVIDYVPSYLTVTSIEGNGSRDGKQITWEGLHLDAGQTGTLRFKVKVNSDAPNGYVLNNRVIASSSDRDLSAEARDTTIVEREAKVAPAVTYKPVAVPVTAKTGAEFTAIASTLLGGSSLALVIRRRVL